MEVEFNIYEKILITIAVCIIIINVYVTSLFVRKQQLRKNSSVLLFSLTMADLFTGFVTVPLIIAAKPVTSHNMEKAKFLFIFGDIATVVSASLTILSLCAVTTDRYVRLCYPMKHMMLARRQRIVTLFCLIWIAAFASALIPLSWLYKVLKPNPSRETYEAVDKMDTEYSIVCAALFAIPVIGLMVAFVRMFYAIRKLGRDEERLAMDAGQDDRRRKRERKAIVLFGSMFILFIICWVPWITLRPFVSTPVFHEIPKGLLNALVVIRFLTSIFNPILYTLHEQNFYRALIADKERIIMCIHGGWKRKRSPSGDSAYKLCRSNRRGTFLSSLKSQDDADNTTTFMPSPIVVRNGKLPAGQRGIHANSNVANIGKMQQYIQDEPQSLPLWVPPKIIFGSEKENEIVWTIPSTPNEETSEGEKGLDKRCKNVEGAYSDEDFGAGSKRCDGAGDQQQRSNDLLGSLAGWKEIESCSEKLKSKEYKDMNKPLLGQEQGGEVCETKPMLQKDNDGDIDESGREVKRGDRKVHREQRTRSLLKTSFIGKLFNAEDLDMN